MARMHFKRYNSDEKAKQILVKDKIPPFTHDCFGGFAVSYNGDDSDGYIYFGFFAHPNIIKLANEINNNFENIKIIIVGMEKMKFGAGDIYYKEKKSRLYSPQYYYGRYNYCLFRVQLNDNYSKESKYILTFALAQIMRGLCPHYAHFVEMKKVKTDFINNNLTAQAIPDYGAWLDCDPSGNFECPREIFDKFDNIELINNLTCGRINFGLMPSIHRLIRVLDGTRSKEYITRIGSVYE